MAFDGEARSAFELVDRPFEPGVFECLDAATVVAHEVMVVFAPGADGFEACAVEADLDAIDIAVPDELLE